MENMKWASAISENPSAPEAAEECAQAVLKDLGSGPDIAFVFISPQHSRHYERTVREIRSRLNCKALLGCSAVGIIGGGRETEEKPAMSVTCAVLPDVKLSVFHVAQDDLPDMDDRPKAWHDLIGVSPDKDTGFVLMADPFSIDADRFVKGLDYAFAGSVKVGGLSSGATKPRENALFLNQHTFREGLVGAALSGNVFLDAVVAQGCRPIGEPMTITACEEGVLLELDGKPPMKVLEELFEDLPPRDRELLRTSLFLGIVMDPTLSDLSRGDFLIRNIVGADPERGVLAIGAELRAGQTVQFHLRDAQTSAEDLSLMLTDYAAKKKKAGVRAGLLFSCLGRGVYLYGTPDHDSRVFKKLVADVPMGGFFCNGELGPVHNATHIHGYTSCFGIFREKAG